MNPATPKTELPPSTQLPKAVFGGSLMSKLTTAGVRAARVRTMPLVAAMAAALALVSSMNGATLVAEYRYNGNLASSAGGAPALVSVDPLGLNAFVTDVVNGQTQQVFNWVGNAVPVTQQAGFTLDTTGLVVTNSYSVEMIFELTQREGQWRRLIDVEDRQSDDGFYVNPGNQLAVYPIISSLTPFTNNVYEHVVLTVDGGTISAYLNGLQQFSGTSTLMDIQFSRQMGFFIDNVVAGGQGEFSNGSIALLRLYAGVLVTPSLSIIRTSTSSVVISWPSPSTGFTLQSATNLVSPAVWSTVAPGPVVVNGQNAVTNPVSDPQKFYRLSQ